MSEMKSIKNENTPFQKKKTLRWTKLFTILAFFYILWVAIVILGIYYLNMGYRWSYFSLEQWVLGGCILLGIFIVLELIFLLITTKQYTSQTQQVEKVFFKEKQLHVFTYPSQAKGGIFSRTYIPLNEHTILRVRTQMIKAEELWQQKNL